MRKEVYMKNVLLIIIAILALTACDELDGDIDLICPVSLASYQQDFISVYTNGVMFLKESEPGACFEHAIDFVEDHKKESAESRCFVSIHQWDRVSEIKDKYVGDLKALSESEIFDYIDTICNINGGLNDRVDEVLSYDFRNDGSVEFIAMQYGTRYRGYIQDFPVYSLSCSAYSISCSLTCAEGELCPLPLPTARPRGQE